MRRRQRRALTAGVLATALVAAGLTATPANARVSTGATVESRPGTFTLITGDRISVDAHGQPQIQRGPGRADMRFVTSREGGHQFVIPVDAMPLLRDGRLDRRLFDLTALGEFGYDDRAADLPLLVAYPENMAAQARAATIGGDGRVRADLPAARALAVRANPDDRVTLWASLTRGTTSARTLTAGVDHIWLDGKRKVSLDRSVPQIGAPAAWQAGFDGTGITVGVLDTGIDAGHPDFAGRLTEVRDFTGGNDPADAVGHGTHVASTIVGSGAASGGRYRGVAPGAKLLVGKVCATTECQDSDIITGMQWLAPQTRVVNLSVGGDDAPGLDPLETAVQELSHQYGTLFVVAAGNEGKPKSVSSPASADDALAVAAVDADDQRAYFSSRGPRIGDNHIKPEISAPGVDIVAAAPGGDYATMAGTSMATPHVAGTAAILAGQHPDWTGPQLKATLMDSAKPTGEDTLYEQGAGRVDIARAVAQPVAADIAAIDFPVQRWPHADDTPITQVVGYRNTGSTPVTLTLTVAPAPAGMLTVSPATLVVPAGGRAEATITVDTRVDATDGVYQGALTATGAGDLRVRTPFALNREIESYDVRLNHTGRDGKPATEYSTVAANLTTGEFTTLDGVPGGGTMRLPKGRYGLYSTIHEGDASTLLVQPLLDVRGPITEAVDARTAKPVALTVPQRDAAPLSINVSANWNDGMRYPGVQLSGASFADVFFGRIGPAVAAPEFTATLGVGLARPGKDGTFRNSPYTYDLAYVSPGDMFTGLTRKLSPKNLATVRTTYRSQSTAATAVRYHRASAPGGSGPIGSNTPIDLPFHGTEYYNTDGGIVWTSTFVEGDNSTMQESTFKPGRTYTQTWNAAPFGPSVTQAPTLSPLGYAGRDGDTISISSLPLFGDAAGRPGSRDDRPVQFRLLRNGTEIGTSDSPWAEFAVPAEKATYRLEATVTRAVPDTLSTSIAVAWTFTSAHTTSPQRLPLTTARPTPVLDDTNTARAGRIMTIPVALDRQAGSKAAPNRTLGVSASFDDGKTWVTLPVIRDVALISHPRRAGFVSLRLTATDTAGNTVTQTIQRAYRIA
ncbi:S8 family peptidase [Micromonospora parathelypteridis]|uniref:Subtilisin family serine protease n=1 Tax=Micromonospora parathelypteridis TaxID=1839617 RepID=A0A840VM98_9ACTN|nr:S8 family serine peptidase [Micromonospora parathelypteridis]MBB5478143.1 subtilisin family serine protease [Micromonospora parathelypteridis]GGO07756.1 serine protease [Micromonospora parathelypteridis]